MKQEIIGHDESANELPHAARGDIPPETWAMIREAGDVAARRLLELLEGKAWARLKVADQARLIELALVRAYGPPVKREARLELRGTVSDAVADSLARLSSADLPENRGRRATRAAGRGAGDAE